MPTQADPESSPWRVALVAGLAAFTAYFAMYAFRKPFAVGVYEGSELFGSALSLKTVFVVSQIFGYAVSKFFGIRVCSGAAKEDCARILLVLVLAAEIALVLFAILPPVGRVVAIFLNGLPLGMVWGLVVRYLEGRRSTEVLLAALSLSYILASGPVKDIGRLLMTWGVDEYWMPAVVGLPFLPIYAVAVWVLHQLPPPDATDRQLRAPRPPLSSDSRWAFIWRFGVGLAPLLVLMFVLTAYRDFRDNFGAELFSELGYNHVPGAFTIAELPGALGVLGALALLSAVRDNRLGLIAVFVTMALGLAMIGTATWLLDTGRISGLAWMSLIGLGAYLAYVPFGAVLFERLIAFTRFAGTSAFAITLADAIGYTGSICLFLARDTAFGDIPRLTFFRLFTYGLAVAGMPLLLAGGMYLLFLRPNSSLDAPLSLTPSVDEEAVVALSDKR